MKPRNTQIDEHALKVDLEGNAGHTASLGEIDAWLEKGRGGYETAELREAFLHVVNPEHWKMDIDAVVPSGMQSVLEYAIPWHTGGGNVTFEDLGSGKMRVTAPGYWSNGMDG